MLYIVLWNERSVDFITFNPVKVDDARDRELNYHTNYERRSDNAHQHHNIIANSPETLKFLCSQWSRAYTHLHEIGQKRFLGLKTTAK